MGRTVISALHSHLDPHNILELIVAWGKARDEKKIADDLIKVEGISH